MAKVMECMWLNDYLYQFYTVKKISGFEDTAKETTQNDTQREKSLHKWMEPLWAAGQLQAA